MNADKLIFRSHMIGAVMPAEKARIPFTKESIKKMVEIYNFSLYSRREEIKAKTLRKGNEREEDSITLLSRITKTVYNKNEERLTDEFLSGVPDLFEGESIKKAIRTLDTKTSWSKNTFDLARVQELEDDYYWQGQAYMALTGAQSHTVAYCLVNGTAKLIMDEKRKAAWEHNIIDPDTKPEEGSRERKVFDLFKQKCMQIEINHIFDLKHFREENPGFDFDNNLDEWHYDIPMEDRLFQFHIERNDADIERMYKRIQECRKWMNENLFKQVKVAA